MTGTTLNQASERLRRLPCFAEADYLAMNPDVAQAGLEAAAHALSRGCAEQRIIFTPANCARAWGEAVARTAGEAQGAAAAGPRTGAFTGDVSVFVSSWSEPSVVYLAENLAGALDRAGATPIIRSERSSPAFDAGAAIVVAPHDFFRLGVGPSWRRTPLACSSLMLNTAPFGSPQFAAALPFLLASRGVLDLSPQTVDILAQAGVPARQCRPGVPPRRDWLDGPDAEHPLIRALPAAARAGEPATADERAIDVSFIGRTSLRRKNVLGRMVSETAHLQTFLYLRQPSPDPIDEAMNRRALFRIAGHVAGRSRIVLRLAADEMPALDWLGVYQAMAAGAAVVTDVCPPHREFRPGLHLFHTDTRHLAEMVRWLIEDLDGRQAAADARAAAQAILGDEAAGAPWTVGVTELLAGA